MTYAERIEQFNRASHSDPLREMQGLYADRLPARRRRFSDRHLLWSAFARETGIWRQAYDAHVRDWQRAVSEETLERFHANPGFALLYNNCRNDTARVHAEWLASLRWPSTPLAQAEGREHG